MTHPLRRIRAERGLSQLELSERSGVAREHISRIENGRGRVRRSTIVALASVLDCRPVDIETPNLPSRRT